MIRYKSLACLVVLSALVSAGRAAQMPTPVGSYTISASNVTMPMSGVVTIPVTFTSVNGFTGVVAVQCVQPVVAGSVNKGPYCEQGGPARGYSLTANGTAAAGVEIVAILPEVEPAVRASSATQAREGSWALAGVLMLGFGLRKKSRWLARAMLAIIGMAVIGLGLSGCGGPPTLTPGTYVFTLNANSAGDIIPSVFASTTATVTVPAGIVTKSNQ